MARRSGRARARGYGPRRGSRSTVGPWLVVAASLAVVALMVGGYATVKKSQIQLDAVTMCPISGPTAVHAVLLDRSDPITPLQAQKLRQVLDKAVGDAALGERIDLYVLAGDGTQALSPSISLCRPRSEGNALYENNAKMAAAYRDRFRKPLADALAAMMEPASTKTSPIMESVKAVCVAAYGGLPKDAPAALTIASDMIQYSPLLDHYRNKDFDDFALTPGFHEVLANCHRANVDVLYLIRPRDVRVQDRRHQLFWEKFFDRENSTLVSMEAI